MSTDTDALRYLANGWRDVSRRNRYDHDRLLRDEDPGPHMTAIQLEWAAREIDQLRLAAGVSSSEPTKEEQR